MTLCKCRKCGGKVCIYPPTAALSSVRSAPPPLHFDALCHTRCHYDEKPVACESYLFCWLLPIVQFSFPPSKGKTAYKSRKYFNKAHCGKVTATMSRVFVLRCHCAFDKFIKGQAATATTLPSFHLWPSPPNPLSALVLHSQYNCSKLCHYLGEYGASTCSAFNQTLRKEAGSQILRGCISPCRI